MRFEYEISKLLNLTIYLVNFLLMLSIELNTAPGLFSFELLYIFFESTPLYILIPLVIIMVVNKVII